MPVFAGNAGAAGVVMGVQVNGTGRWVAEKKCKGAVLLSARMW